MNFPHTIRFGNEEDEMNYSHGVCLYGDVADPAAPYLMDAATATVPDQAALTDHQKVSFWFRFSTIRPYGDVLDLFNAVMDRLEKEGWQAAQAIEGFPDTGSSVNDLVDTDTPAYWGKPEAEFSPEPNAHGYNAAGGFTVIVEKEGTKPEFSDNEIEDLRQLAVEFTQIVYGRTFPEIE